jgi:pimeloyl-ACP methyl ester carboxylesterase
LLVLAACGGGGGGNGLADGSVTRAATALNLSNTGNLNAASTGQVFAYQMTGAKGQTINASAMLFTPRSAAPAGGWPLLVFGHGTVGWAQTCSPTSVIQGGSPWSYQDLVAALVSLDKGYAVVAPDYEGLGPADLGVVAGHPYLNLESAGKSMVYAVVAAKSVLGTQLSGKWAAIGHSQGGHAALAAAQYSDLAAKQNASLVYKGAVAVAPASGLLSSLNALQGSIATKSQSPGDYPEGYELLGTLTGYAALLVKGTQSTLAPVANATIFPNPRNELQNILAFLNTQCAGDVEINLRNEIANYSQSSLDAKPSAYPGVNAAAVNSTTVSNIISANEPGQTKLPVKTLIVQGLKDTTVLPGITQLLVDNMKAKGSTVDYKTYANETHSSVLTPSATDVGIYLSTLFAQ